MCARKIVIKMVSVSFIILFTIKISINSFASANHISQNPSLYTDNAYFFREDFNGTSLNPELWQVYLNEGTVSVDSGWVTLDNGIVGRFPYVHTKYNVVPTSGNFSLKFGIQYLSVTGFGDGFSVDDRLPANGSPGSWSWLPTIYTLWQDSNNGYFIFDNSGIKRYYTRSPNLNYHEIEFRWLDTADEYYVDGSLVNTVPRNITVPRPVSIWFGNPVIPEGGSLDWSNFKLDYIEVTSLTQPPISFNLPIDYPGRENPTREQFIDAWKNCVTSIFDHYLPYYKFPNGDGFLWNYIGEKIPASECNYDENCYDGHEGVDFDDFGSCYQSTNVYPVAAGTIVTSETGWRDDGYGNRVVIQHGDTGYKTLYGHLREIITYSGTVTQNTQIGIIGNTGCDKCGTHLHLSVYYNNTVMDPSGWDPIPWYEDPYSYGPASYLLWIFSPRRSTPVNDSVGTTLITPSGEAAISIPPYAYGEDYIFALTEFPSINLPNRLRSTNHTISMQAQDFYGQVIRKLDQDIYLEVHFNENDIRGIQESTLSIYEWNADLNIWNALPTTISYISTYNQSNHVIESGIASTITRNISYIALLGDPYREFIPIISR